MSGFVQDLSEVRVGDARATRRIVESANRLAANPQATLPQAMGGNSALEGLYRVMNREDTTHDAILRAHAMATARRAASLRYVLALHDTTEIEFNDTGSEREHLSQLSSNRQGFYAHTTLIVANNGTKQVLGVASMLAYVHRSQVGPEAAAYWARLNGIWDNEVDRWSSAIKSTDRQLKDAGVEQVVHVCDREGDAWPTLSTLQMPGYDYVVRCAATTRSVEPGEHGETSLVRALATAAVGKETRLIQIPDQAADKPAKTSKGPSKASPKLPTRPATVAVRFAEVTLVRPDSRSAEHATDSAATITVRVVEVTEVNPPEGRRPAQWLLYTSLPLETEEDAWTVVDIYCTRWVIEEYFKALKTGTAYESRQFESAHSLLNMLAISAVVAGDILALRTWERHYPDEPATTLFDEGFVDFVVASQPTHFKTGPPTMRQLLLAVAAHGGHLKRNGPPGWLVLYRGLSSLQNAWQVLETMMESKLARSYLQKRMKM